MARPAAALLLHAAPCAAVAAALLHAARIPAPLAAACIAAPLVMALATTRLWFCRASLDAAAEAQAAVFAVALAGTGMEVLHSRSREGLAVVEFRAVAAAAEGGGWRRRRRLK